MRFGRGRIWVGKREREILPNLLDQNKAGYTDNWAGVVMQKWFAIEKSLGQRDRWTDG